MREYRLIRKKKGDLYFPQVREDKCLFKIGSFWAFPFKSEWQRIVRHPDWFGLNDEYDFSDGNSWAEARQIILDYEESFMDDEPPYVFSYDSQASIRQDIERRNNL